MGPPVPPSLACYGLATEAAVRMLRLRRDTWLGVQKRCGKGFL
jgi:hypothetical protein